MLPLLALLANGGVILEARLDATVDEGPDVAVHLAYRIEAPGAARVAFSVLEIDGVAIEEISAFAGQTPLRVELAPRPGPKREGSIDIPNDTSAIELRYIVRGGAERTEDGLRVRLPCIVPDLKIRDTRTGLFSSTVRLPVGLSVVDGFPSQSVVAADGAHLWELPLVPTFVAFRASSGTVLLTPPRVVTTAVVLLFLAVGFVGMRRARASRA